MERNLALMVNKLDNVATVFASGVVTGNGVEVRDKGGNSVHLTVRDAIPYGHKIAVKAIRSGERITKYGEEIGVATADIEPGDHVHVHNLDSMRGRGDLQGGCNEIHGVR